MERKCFFFKQMMILQKKELKLFIQQVQLLVMNQMLTNSVWQIKIVKEIYYRQTTKMMMMMKIKTNKIFKKSKKMKKKKMAILCLKIITNLIMIKWKITKITITNKMMPMTMMMMTTKKKLEKKNKRQIGIIKAIKKEEEKIRILIIMLYLKYRIHRMLLSMD